MQHACNVISNTHALLIEGKFFEGTQACLRELPGSVERLSSSDVSSLRRAYTTGIARCQKAEKQIEDALAAIEALDARDAARQSSGGVQKVASSADMPAQDVAKIRKPWKRERQVDVAARSTKAQRSVVRPPHMDRTPAVNELVAAKIASHELWILATVNVLNAEGTLQVKDYDSDRTFALQRSQILTLPAPGEIKTEKWLAPGMQVMAMYPETTSFYSATVSSIKGDSCDLQFADDEDETGILPSHAVPVRVITLRN